MADAEQFNPHLENVHPLQAKEVDSHIEKLLPHIVYYGEMPDGGAETHLRQNHPAIEVPDDSGEAKYSVLLSGNLDAARTVLVRPMSWSDHPGRGFEALREGLIADPEQGLAVVGVSFPGSGFSSERMTPKQRQQLKTEMGFSYIGGQQWVAIETAMIKELMGYGLTQSDAKAKLSTYDFVLSGHSQGASNSVGLFQAAPEELHIAALGLVEDVAMEAQGWLKFRLAFLTRGTTKFSDYTAANAYNHYPELGPDWGAKGLVKNVATRPASHFGSVVKAMRVGADMDKIIDTIKQRDIQSLAITLANGSLGLGSVHAAEAQAQVLNRTAKIMKLSDSIIAKTIVWPRHYHAAMENLANAQHTSRSFTH